MPGAHLQLIGPRLMGAWALALAACSAPAGGWDDGVPGRGGACETQRSCAECSGCRPPGQEICVSGQCWLAGEPDAAGEPVLASYLVVLDGRSLAGGASVRSAALRVLAPLDVNASPVTCAGLLADPAGVDARTDLNVLRRLEPPVSFSAADIVNVGANELPVGTGRLVLVRLHAEAAGAGAVLGAGCVEDLTTELGAPCESDAECGYNLGCELPDGTGTRRCGPQRVAVPLAS